MPREQWSIEIQADISRALGQLQALRAQIAGLGSGSAAIRPTFDASGVQRGVQTMTTALNQGKRTAQSMTQEITASFGNFSRIFASRLAFTFATAVERLIIGSLLLIPKAFAGAIQAGAQFEDALRRTATVAAGGFGDIEGAMAKLGATARSVGATTTFTAVEVASAMFELVSVGLSVAETQDAITASSELAVAIQTDLGTAIDITTQIMKAFGLNSSELADIGDKLTFAIDNTTLNVSRLQAALRFAAPAAGALGISFDDMITVVAKFVDVTKQGGIAGRAFRFMISALADPTDKARDRIEKLGLSVEDVDPQMNSLTDIMKKFAFTTLDGGDALAIFGKRAGGTVAGAITDIRLGLAAGTDALEEFKAGLIDAANLDLAKKQAQEFMRTLVSQWRIFVSKITELGLQIFDVIGPAVIGATLAVNGFLDVVIEIGPFLKIFLGLLIAIAAVKIATGLTQGTIAMTKFIVSTLRGTKALKGMNTLMLTQTATSKTMGTSILGASTMTGKLRAVIGKIFPFIKKFAGRAGLLAVVAGFILWVKQSALLGDTMTFFGNLLVSILPSFDSLEQLIEAVNLKWLFFKDMLDVIIHQGFDIFISTIIGLFGRLVGAIADVLSGLGLLDEANSTLRNLESAAKDAAQHVLDMAASQDEARVAVIRMEAAVLTLNQALKIQINSLDDFRTKEAAVVKSFNELTDAGKTQEDAMFLLQDALRDLFLNAEIVGGEYSNSLIPLMAEAERMFNFSGVAAETAAEKLERLGSAFSAIFGTSGPEVQQALTEIFDALEAVEDGAGQLTDGQLLMLVERLDELEESARDAGIEMERGLGARFNLVRLTVQALGGDLVLLTAGAVDASAGIGTIPEAITEVETGFTTFQDLGTLIDDVKKKFDLARILITGGFAPPGAMDEIKKDVAEIAQRFVDVKVFSGQSSDAFLEMAANLKFVRLEGESVELFTRRIAASAQEADQAYAEFFKNVRKGIALALGELIVKGKSFSDTMKKLFDGIFVSNLTTGIEKALGTFDILRTGGVNMMDSIKGAVKSFRKQLDGPMNASILGTRAAMGGWGDVGMSAMSAISNFAKGDWIGGILASIGAIAGALKNAFGGTTALKEIKKLGLSISDNLIKTIEEAEKKLGDYGAAIRTNLAAIIKEEGIPNIAKLNQFLGMQTALLSDLDRGTISSSQAMSAMNDSMTLLLQSAIDLNSPQGFAGVITTLADVIRRTQLTGAGMITAAQATQLLNDQFPAITAAVQNFGVAGAEAMRTLIDGAREAGLQIESINTFVIEQSSTLLSKTLEFIAATAIEVTKTVTDANGKAIEVTTQVATLTANQVRFAALAVITAFTEMAASGVPLRDIMSQMGDGLKMIADRAKELGIKLPASFQQILGLGRVFQNEVVAPQLDGLSLITQAMQALLALGLRPTQQEFAALGDQAKIAFDTMIDQGFKGKMALRAISPDLVIIRDLAEKFGLAIDDNTQSLIDQATEQGILGAATMSDTDVMKTGFDNIAKAINRLITTMGGVPIALKTFGDEVVIQGAKMQNEFLKTGAVLKNEVVSGIVEAQREIANLGSDASTQMTLFSDSARLAVGSALRDFQDLQNKLVGNTIIGDIAEKGSDFMKEWGDFTHDVVDGVGDDFKRLQREILGPDSEADLRRHGIFNMPDHLLRDSEAVRSQRDRERSSTSTSTRSSSSSGQSSSLGGGDVLRVLKRIARAVEAGQNVNVSISSASITRSVTNNLVSASLNGRLTLDEGVVQQLQG